MIPPLFLKPHVAAHKVDDVDAVANPFNYIVIQLHVSPVPRSDNRAARRPPDPGVGFLASPRT